MPKFDNFHILKTFRVIQSNLSFYSSHWELHAKIDIQLSNNFCVYVLHVQSDQI